MSHPLSHKYPISISQLCLVNTDVTAGVAAPPLDTTASQWVWLALSDGQLSIDWDDPVNVQKARDIVSLLLKGCSCKKGCGCVGFKNGKCGPGCNCSNCVNTTVTNTTGDAHSRQVAIDVEMDELRYSEHFAPQDDLYNGALSWIRGPGGWSWWSWMWSSMWWCGQWLCTQFLTYFLCRPDANFQWRVGWEGWHIAMAPHAPPWDLEILSIRC